MSALSTPYGTTYLAGKLAPGALSSTVSLPCATLDLSPQTEAWVLYRDERRVAVSLGLSQAPDMHLWDQRTLRLGWVQRARWHGPLAATPGCSRLQLLAAGVWCHAAGVAACPTASCLYEAAFSFSPALRTHRPALPPPPQRPAPGMCRGWPMCRSSRGAPPAR